VGNAERDPIGPEGPSIRVGLLNAPTVHFSLSGRYRVASSGEILESGDYTASAQGSRVTIAGYQSARGASLDLSPLEFESCRTTIHAVTIGVDFHWQRQESQQFQGSLLLIPRGDDVLVVNRLPLENYLVSVISSEMSALCPSELLRAHSIVSRSWLLAQIRSNSGVSPSLTRPATAHSSEIIRWYDRESHVDFDVCADDHCQRYQGISKAFSAEAFDAVQSTRGCVLIFDDEVCDARYSKSCGGVTEEFRTAWADRDVPYLSAVRDFDTGAASLMPNLTGEEAARSWIESSPPAFCNPRSTELLARILPDFDQETRDFYRWRVDYSQQELRQIITERLGDDLGPITDLKPLTRGKSGRIIRLEILGGRESLVVGKELEIRRILSRSHLYSSAFIVRTQQQTDAKYPERFTLVGAGWGHGVGLCQIGAAVMAGEGYQHRHILEHYFSGVELKSLY
jgi:stage II sporulation protein D